jgi:hypothetical protein
VSRSSAGCSGGSLLSIAALIVITLCQHFNSSLGELRSDLGHLNEDLRKELGRLNETDADLLKKEEFSFRMKSVWDGMKELREGLASIAALKERAALADQRLKIDEDDAPCRHIRDSQAKGGRSRCKPEGKKGDAAQSCVRCVPFSDLASRKSPSARTRLEDTLLLLFLLPFIDDKALSSLGPGLELSRSLSRTRLGEANPQRVGVQLVNADHR